MQRHNGGRDFARSLITSDCSLTVRLRLRSFHEFRQTKVEDLGVVVACDHYVVWLEIAMDDAGRVSFGQTFSNLPEVFQKFAQRSLVAVNLVAQRDSIDKLHRDEVSALTLTNFINVRDVRMIECRRGCCLLIKAPHPILIRGNLGRKNLQRDFAVQSRVFRKIHLTHSARAEQRPAFVAAEFGPRTKSHYLGVIWSTAVECLNGGSVSICLPRCPAQLNQL